MMTLFRKSPEPPAGTYKRSDRSDNESFSPLTVYRAVVFYRRQWPPGSARADSAQRPGRAGPRPRRGAARAPPSAPPRRPACALRGTGSGTRYRKWMGGLA